MGHKPYGTSEQRKEAARKGGLANKGVKKKERSQEHKNNLSKAVKGYHWYTNGIEDTRCLPENAPDGWWPGHSKGGIPGNVSKKCYNNGIENKYFNEGEQPEGYVLGVIGNCGKYDHSFRGKKVMCIETGIIYNSISSAENETKIKNISSVCRGKRELAGGYH